jgi:hypothetical protein
MVIYILVFTVLYAYFRSKVDYLYFEPAKKRNIEEFNNLNPKYPCIQIDNHYALYRKGVNGKKVMIISHGNAGSFLDRGYMFDKLDNYSGDIYLFEYPGFSGIDGKTNITSCVQELEFWIFHLSTRYEKIDLYGESIGGGIIVEACSNHSIDFINKIYLQSTFTSMRDVIRDLNSGLYIIYNILFLDDLNTSKSLEKISCNKYVIIHSPDDKLIKYEQAEKNYLILENLNKQVKFITGSGSHGNTLFELNKKRIKKE